MTGWFVALVLWLLGIGPAITGVKELFEEEKLTWKTADATYKFMSVLFTIGWPLAAVMELVGFFREEDNDRS